MAYDRQFLNLEYLFSIQFEDEVAATGIRITGPNTLFPAATALAALTTAQGAELIDAYFDIFRTVGIRWADYSIMTGLKVSAVGVDGHYLTEPRIFTPGSTLQGNQGAVQPQSTVVVSLRSSTTFGKANYGRAYLPHTLMALEDGTPHAQAPSVLGARDGAAGWINRVNAVSESIDPGYKVSILSNGSAGPGVTKVVTRVGVGNVIDTQRRRRNRLREVYQFGAVA